MLLFTRSHKAFVNTFRPGDYQFESSDYVDFLQSANFKTIQNSIKRPMFYKNPLSCHNRIRLLSRSFPTTKQKPNTLSWCSQNYAKMKVIISLMSYSRTLSFVLPEQFQVTYGNVPATRQGQCDNQAVKSVVLRSKEAASKFIKSETFERSTCLLESEASTPVDLAPG